MATPDDTDGISAAVSTNRRRGRPRVFDDATVAWVSAEMRGDRFGWADGDLEYHPVNPEEEAC